jgi:ABC-type transporter Mla subunit MlaD
MSDQPVRTDPFSDVISLVAGPIAAVIRSFDQLRKGADEMRRGFENFNSTMENLNETAARINRLLNDFEEPVRAMIPQLTRTVKLADEMSKRLATPIDEVAPGLARLATTLNSPVLRSLPTDLGQFLEVINELSRRLSPLTQFADQAGSLFGLRIPGLPSRPAAQPAPPAPPPEPAPVKKAPATKRAAKRRAPAKKKAPARKKAAASARQ